jgi:hypothetical protein
MTASYIEACSCDMFCPCYFNTHSTNHMGMGEHHMDEHFCRANLVLKVDKGHYKETKLDGAKVWLGSDLGSDWSTGKDSWLVANFDPSVSKQQEAGLLDVLTQGRGGAGASGWKQARGRSGDAQLEVLERAVERRIPDVEEQARSVRGRWT